jgi:hypothetical protein
MTNTNPSWWFAGKIRELGELLRRLPDARQRAFRDELGALRASENDDRRTAKGETRPGGSIVLTRQTSTHTSQLVAVRRFSPSPGNTPGSEQPQHDHANHSL